MKTRQQIIKEAILNELMTATTRYIRKSPVQAAVSAVKGFVTGQGAREGVRRAALADYRGDALKSQERADEKANWFKGVVSLTGDNLRHAVNVQNNLRHTNFSKFGDEKSEKAAIDTAVKAGEQVHNWKQTHDLATSGLRQWAAIGNSRELGIQRAANRQAGIQTPPTR